MYWCFGNAMLQPATALPVGYESFWNASEDRARRNLFRLTCHQSKLSAPLRDDSRTAARSAHRRIILYNDCEIS